MLGTQGKFSRQKAGKIEKQDEVLRDVIPVREPPPPQGHGKQGVMGLGRHKGKAQG